MTTELRKFNEAYATMVVAVYQPLILKWYSGWTIFTAADVMAWRLQKGKHIRFDGKFATAQALNIGRQGPKLPAQIPGVTAVAGRVQAADVTGRAMPGVDVQRVDLKGFPDAVAIGGKVYPHGVLNVEPAPAKSSAPGLIARMLGRTAAPPKGFGNSALGARTLPTYLNGRMGAVDADFDFGASRKALFQTMINTVNQVVAGGRDDLEEALAGAMKDVNGVGVFQFLPTRKLNEALSPIGIAHYYRQLYFNVLEGVGPIEQAFTIAPKETFEVVYETTRRQVHEEIVEIGSETVSEQAEETKNLDEVSDKVSSMIQRDSQAAMSANGSGSIGVWSFGASASASMAVSSQNSREQASRQLKEVTKRASERITKTFSLKTRDLEDVTTTNLTRRVIKNESEVPVSYGLRRVLRRVKVKVQDLGPRLVWQLYVRNPGAGLARSRFVRFREAEPIAIPEVPPGVPPRPRGGTDTGSTSADLQWNSSLGAFVRLVITVGADRIVTAVSIDSITDLEGGGKDDPAPSPKNDLQANKQWDEATRTFTVDIGVLPGDASSLSINYTYAWDPAGVVMDEWEALRALKVSELTQAALNEQFEREKTLITERSKIRPRPANDLRQEERYEVMNRMISHLFARGDDPSDPSPLEIEYFHRYFDIDGMFVYLHPSWWKPRYAPTATGLERPAYEITAESEPAPLGSSLGWMIQLDGDARRNGFINSPWLRICLPIRPTRERESIDWLAKHVEGSFGYNPAAAPLSDLLATMEQRRQEEAALGVNGPEYVTVNSDPGAPAAPLTPEGVFPVVNEFEVTVPTDGFVYDELVVRIP